MPRTNHPPNTTCQHCKKPFYRYPYQIRTGKGIFCSTSCRNATFKNVPQSPENVQKRSESRKTTDKTGHKIEMICDNCGEPFSEYRHRRNRPYKFCSRSCCQEWAKRTGRGTKIESIDMEAAQPPKPSEPGMTVIYDPVKKELRNV